MIAGRSIETSPLGNGNSKHRLGRWLSRSTFAFPRATCRPSADASARVGSPVRIGRLAWRRFWLALGCGGGGGLQEARQHPDRGGGGGADRRLLLVVCILHLGGARHRQAYRGRGRRESV